MIVLVRWPTAHRSEDGVWRSDGGSWPSAPAIVCCCRAASTSTWPP